MVQKEPGEGESSVDIVMLTHRAIEKNVNAGDGEDREAADRGRQGDAHPPGGAAVVLLTYVSTARRGARPQALHRDPARRPRADGGLYVPETFPQRWTSPQLARARPIRSSPSRSCRASWTTCRTCGAIVERTYTREDLRQRRDHAAARRSSPACTSSACPTARRSRSRTSRCSCSASCSRTRCKERRDPQHPRRHLGRHRLGGRVRDARQAGHQRVHALAARAHERRSSARRCTRCRTPNIHNLAVRGRVRRLPGHGEAVNADAAFKAQHRIGAVNSINWARVAAQVVYYFKGYFAATRDDDEQVSFAVPSGNFGNIYAGYVARRMGLPIRTPDPRHQRERRARRVLPHRPLPRARSPCSATSSPSMDISKASNFERYVFDLVGRDGARVKDAVAQARRRGRVRPLAPRTGRGCARASSPARARHADRLATIRGVSTKYGVMIDPHTADGVKVGLEHREAGVPLICLETALPAKFADTHPRGARPRARAAGGIRGPRAPAAALQRDRARCRGREALHRARIDG